ncbi:MAG: hypothetical protein KAS30_02300 [Candidatus Diapherotrites archaeon]|nr:hypothetical protein [Candidatus Diapherotrites archaeon]
MIRKSKNAINNLSFNNPQIVKLVSGGAALSDHIAVELFLSGFVKKLTLYFPCKWNEKKCEFMDKGPDNWRTNPGKLANSLHHEFGKRLKKNSLYEIQMAIDKGADIVIGKGFYARNLQIAATSKGLIAFTFDKKMTPGTSHTWKACKIDEQLKKHYII